MYELTELLNNPEEHYPGNFDTPERANALLTGLCQDAANEIAKLQAEVLEQCRVNGMSAEREDALRAEIKRLKSAQPAPSQYGSPELQAMIVAHCEAGPEYCQQCHLEDRSLALAAAVRYVKNNTPKLVADEICMALTAPPAAQPAPVRGFIKKIEDLIQERDDARASLDFYKRRADALQQWQSKMRDPERTIVCDILANGCTLEPAGDRYTPPTAQPAVQEGRDWSLLEATQESLREHMAEIKRLKAAQPAVIQQMVDALDHADELLGGNDTLVMNGAAAGRWLLEQPAVQEPDELKHIGEQDSLLDVDERAWHLLVENRGGCRCHISPPCGACSNPISEEEMNEVGYTYNTPPAPQPVPVKTYHDGKPWPVAPKPWVGLTETEIDTWNIVGHETLREFIRAIESKLKEKNT
jgi:hypothetical protein